MDPTGARAILTSRSARSAEPTLAPVTVIKIGGSVLVDGWAYQRAAGFVERFSSERPERRLVVVVSAQEGVTDALLTSARSLVAEPDTAVLDLLWSTGELQSVALLTLALQARGIRAAATNVHQTGLLEPDTPSGHTVLRPLRLQMLLATGHVVVPGFLARRPGDGVMSLGRGGSDLTAVLLAAGLGADSCVLVKDVAGYFSTDPNVDPAARHLPQISYARALEMADNGCALVQGQALLAASRHGVPLVVRSMESETRTVVAA